MARLALSLASWAIATASGSELPSRPDVPPVIQFFGASGQVQGHRYAGSGDSVHRLDVYLGPLCEDSNAFWPVLKELAAHYGGGALEVRVFMFPLPYNFGSFIVAQACAAAHAIEDVPKGRLQQGSFFRCVDYLYSHQHEIKLKAQFNHSQPEMIEAWADIMERDLSISRSDFLLQMSIDDLEGGNTSYWLAKADWKFGTSRGVWGTPSYFLNDVQLGQSADYLGRWNLTRWTAILDPVLRPGAEVRAWDDPERASQWLQRVGPDGAADRSLLFRSDDFV